MLQQTRVETVIPYYERFLRRFPDITALAEASNDEVLKRWEGLGYYRRANHLHQAVKELATRNESLPTTAKELRRLPGIGDYTSAAIAAIAYNEPAAAVDGNVARVLARVLGLEMDVTSTAGKRIVQAYADQLLARRRPGDFNQAWMDLGSSICTPRQPDCTSCPLSPTCLAVATGQAEVLPIRDSARNGKVRDVTLVIVVLVCDGKMLVRRRPLGGLWSGLWEFPTVEPKPRQRPSGAARLLVMENGLVRAGRLRDIGTVEHLLTHRRLSMRTYLGRTDQIETPSPKKDHRWVTVRGFSRLSVSTAHRRIFAMAEPYGGVE